MRIGRTSRLYFPLHFQNPAMWFGVLAAVAGLLIAPALAQGPPGAAAAAAGAAAAATSAAPAPAPKRSAAAAAMDAAALGNSGLTPAGKNESSSAEVTEEAANSTAPAGGAQTAASPGPAVPLTGVAAQCANLLKMATNLKTDVDKTNQDVLSVAVVRDAGQIEEMAKKMRTQQH